MSSDVGVLIAAPLSSMKRVCPVAAVGLFVFFLRIYRLVNCCKHCPMSVICCLCLNHFYFLKKDMNFHAVKSKTFVYFL